MRKLFIALTIILFIFLSFSSCSCTAFPLRTSALHPATSFLFMESSVSVLSCVGEHCKVTNKGTSGSGFVAAASDKGAIGITAGHVCSQPAEDRPYWLKITTEKSSLKATLSTGKSITAKVLAVYEKEDLCVFLLKGVYLPHIPVAYRAPQYGEEVHTLAAPLGIYEPTAVPIFTGRYFGIFREEGVAAYSIPTIFGSSGSPILDSRGRLVGVTSKAFPAFPQVALSPKFKTVQYLVKSIRKGNLPYSLSGEGL